MIDPTPDQLASIVSLSAEKRDFDRQVRAIEAQLDPLKQAVRDWMSARGVRSCQKHHFRLTLIDGRANVKWKDEFVRVAGAEAAVKATADSPKLILLDIQPVKATADSPKLILLDIQPVEAE